ncbi:MAG: hypothetical protein ISS66_07870 [Desulfobacteraceae bacterium]|nr:hypothetical protein [Desulfobacteraceae bacterium]
MKPKLTQQAVFDSSIQDKLAQNPLVCKIGAVIGRVGEFKKQAREYYFEVVLSAHQCPSCGGHLRMTGQSQCTCSCGSTLDPTIAFQRSNCCGAKLIQKTFHYACSKCHNSVPSRFFFDERVFDKSYFRDMMRESRRKAKEKREEITRLLAESRSGNLPLMEDPDLEAIPGLIQDLNAFIQQESFEIGEFTFDTGCSFRMDDYRQHILSTLSWDSIAFSKLTPIIDDFRQDKVWRFITLVFMDNDRELELRQLFCLDPQ